MDRPDPAGSRPGNPTDDVAAHGSRSAPLQVLVVGISWPMETFVERLLTGLASRGVALTIMSPRRPPTAWLDQRSIRWIFGLKALDAREIARQTRSTGVRATARTTWRWAHDGGGRGRDGVSAVQLQAYDVIYAPWISTLTEREPLLHAGPPIVTSCRGSLITSAPWNPLRRDHRDALPRVFEAASLVHCVSERIVADAEDLGLDRAKARVIRPAVDPTSFRPRPMDAVPNRTVRAVGVGGLNWPKDHEHALLALRKALDRGADVRLDLIGEGGERQHLRYAIDDLGLEGRARLLGSRSPEEVATALREADILLHTSSSEGIANAVLEGMASGLAVITTEAGGMREAVRDGVEGFVVGVRNAEATADALLRLSTDPGLRSRMGTAGRARIQSDFRLDAQITAFDRLLTEASGR